MDKLISKKLFKLALVVLFITFCKNSYGQLPEFHGFIEADYGIKISDDKTKRDSFNLLEQRLQLKTTYLFKGDNYLADKGGVINFKSDFLVDEYFSGKTDFDLREINLSLTPFDIIDLKLGRQILTWGTGDYLFINDMFSKDYVSFFIGRDDEYLKKPSDAIKLSFYPDMVNIDFVIIPSFTANNHAQGDRVSFFDSFQGGIAGLASDRHLVHPSSRLSNSEYALRFYRNFGSNEIAAYYFRGFDKSPRSYKNEAERQLYYERLDVYGASIRGPIFQGIGNIEAGLVNSREDSNGDNRLIENSMFKAMLGYSKDLGNDLRIGLQYYYEQKLDYENYSSNLLPLDYFWDKHRHIVTNRITKLLINQTLMLSFFVFYSPSDKDGYARPSVTYDINDRWKITLGANLPWGEDDITEFGQMKKNKNIFTRVRFSF